MLSEQTDSNYLIELALHLGRNLQSQVTTHLERSLSSPSSSSVSAAVDCSTHNKDSPDARITCETEPSKAELMEAFRHSQIRAREAESAAQKAYHEKEHIVKLFFKQASHLFAYKQWLQLLQLESILLQLKNKDQSLQQPSSASVPSRCLGQIF